MSAGFPIANTAGDPPVPNRTTRITPPTAAMVAKDNLTLGILGAICIVIASICFFTAHPVAGSILGGLALVFLISIFTKKSDVGQCPFCMAEFRETVSVSDGLLRCEKCGEYSEIANKTAKPLSPATQSDKPKFESAVFQKGSMPNACALCGAAATRLDTVTTSSTNKTLAAVGAARLLTGTPGLAVFSSKQASISVPYCDEHRDAVTIGFDWSKHPVLKWSSLRMLRRYLAANRGKAKY